MLLSLYVLALPSLLLQLLKGKFYHFSLFAQWARYELLVYFYIQVD